MDKILVTGGNGWLGSRLVERLAKEYEHAEIRSLVLPQERRPLPFPQVKQYSGDICDKEDCDLFCAGAKGATIFHTAGIIHPRRIKDLYKVNVFGTENLILSAVRNCAKRIIAISSNSVCGCGTFDESSPYNPYLNYGESKLEMEQSIDRATLYMETVVIRPCWFYGPNQPPRQSLFFEMIRDGKVPIVGDGHNFRSMSYIDNLCDGLLLAANSDRAINQTYWIADERAYTMNEIVDTVEQLLENEFKIKCAHKRLKLPSITSSIAYAVDAALQSVGLYNQKIHVLSEMNKTIACSIAKAQRELGYTPKVSLKEGMRRSIRWCIDKGIKL